MEQLNQHISEEHSVKSFPCDLCKFSTEEKGKLEQHFGYVHDRSMEVDEPEVVDLSNLETFFCDVCNFTSFSLEATMKHKEAKHSLTCERCTFKTLQVSTMKAHEEKHDSVLILKALQDLTKAVGAVSNDVLQMKSDSITVNNHLMRLIKDEIVQEITEKMSLKFLVFEEELLKSIQEPSEDERKNQTEEVHQADLKDVDIENKKNTEPTKKNEPTQKESKRSYAHAASSEPKVLNEQRELPKKTKTKNKHKPHNILIVADSHSRNLDYKVLEKATETKVTLATAYTVDADVDAKYPNKNFMEVTQDKLIRREYDTLIVQGGCNEISNISVTENPAPVLIKAWEEKVRTSRRKMFELATPYTQTYGWKKAALQIL